MCRGLGTHHYTLILSWCQEFEDALLLDHSPTPSKLLVDIFRRFLDGIIDTEIT